MFTTRFFDNIFYNIVMNDNLKRLRAIREALKDLYPGEPKGNLVRHLHVLAAIISGIIGSRSTNLPLIAGKTPDNCKVESRAKRFSRWINNERIDCALYFIPFAQALLDGLSKQTLVLVMDGSTVGRGCITLMISVVYKKRALPIAWLVVKGKKGHLPESLHLDLLDKVRGIVPKDSSVVFLGDGEFDGIDLQERIDSYGWEYVCRTGKNSRICDAGYWLSLEEMGVQRGDKIGIPEVEFTLEAYGPVLVIAWWEAQYKEAIYLVTNMELVEEACYWYGKRFRIETFFSDQKSRGFNLHKSHISDLSRLSRLMIAACLAYIWIIYLGAIAITEGWVKIIHRTSRCDLSLFQLGLRLLEYFLNDNLPIPVGFRIPGRALDS